MHVLTRLQAVVCYRSSARRDIVLHKSPITSHLYGDESLYFLAAYAF